MADSPRTTVVRAHAPVRTADVGGWTDTWFAGRGMVTNVAVAPGVTVTVTAVDDEATSCWARVEEVGLDAALDLRDPAASADPFLANAVAIAQPTVGIRLDVSSAVPAGSGLGTSAALAVAVIGAVWRLEGRPIDRVALAAAAHRVETSLGLQSGVQDQLGAAFGGIHRFEIRYPDLGAVHSLTDDPAGFFRGRLLTVYLGRPHSSSAVHEHVIAELEAGGHRGALDDIKVAAMNAAGAVRRDNLAAFGRAMTEHNDATRRLDPTIVSAAADEIGALAMAHGAFGWKTNGAGGEGGTISIVTGDDPDGHAALVAELNHRDEVRVLDLTPTGEGFGVLASE